MALLYLIYWLPVVMVGVICLAIVGKVREGRYKNAWLGFGAERPAPGAAVARVVIPMAGVLIWALLTKNIGGKAFAVLFVCTTTLGFLVYQAAAKRWAQSGIVPVTNDDR